MASTRSNEAVAREYLLAKFETSLEGLASYVRPLRPDDALLLVGSIADGIADPYSDVDLMIIVDDRHASHETGVDSADYRSDRNAMLDVSIDVSAHTRPDLARLASRMHRYIDRLFSSDSRQPQPSVSLLSDQELHLLHKLRAGIAISGSHACERLRAECRLDELPTVVLFSSLHRLFRCREDAQAQLAHGDEHASIWLLRFAADALACAMLASLGESHVRSKWRTKLVRKHATELGTTDVNALFSFLNPPGEYPFKHVLGEFVSYSYGATRRILDRQPELIPATTRLYELVVQRRFDEH
jgi:hypothetical protein